MPKSSVGGLGRNYKRSRSYNSSAGQVNMKGKRTKKMRCGCCDVVDFRGKELLKEHNKEIDSAWASK